MKQTLRFFHGLVACGIALAMVTSVSAQMRNEVAKVIRIKGEARYTTGGGIWQPLKVGETIPAGSVVQTDTATGSYVDVVIGDASAVIPPVAATDSTVIAPSKGGLVKFQPATQQNALRIFENTALGFDKLTAMNTGADVVTETQLDLKQGHILGNVKKMNAASRYEIKLPNGVAGIRGTIFHIWADGRIQVSSGAVVYSYLDPQGNVQTREVMGGQGYDPSRPAPGVGSLPSGVLQWMQSVVSGLGVAAYAPAPVTLDQTTYYVQPRISPTGGTAPVNGE